MASESRLPLGLPLLSGPPPPPTDSTRAEISCRKCNKEFNIIFTRQKKCNHCGYSYCSSCVDYQALMPRGGTESGYVAMPVCAFCIEFLNITAAARGQLKSLPLNKLKRYVDAYNIKVDRAVEKDDYLDAIIAARCQNGCLSYANEEYYRKYSIPSRSNSSRPRGLFGRTGLGSNAPSRPPPPPPPPPPNRPREYIFPRPDLAPDDPVPPAPEQPAQFHFSPPPGPPPRPPPSSQSRQSSAPPRPPRPQVYSQYNPSPRPPPPRPPRPPSPDQWWSAPQPEPYRYTPTPSPPPRPPPPPGQRHQAPPMPPFPQPQSPPMPAFSQPQYHSSRYQFPAQEPHQRHSFDTVNVPRPTSFNATDDTHPRSTSTSPMLSSPSLDDILLMSPQAISALPISTLKTILFTNHVNAGMILEKGELVVKVNALVEEERRTRERQRQAEEQEALETFEMQRDMLAEHERAKQLKEANEKGKQDAEQIEGPAPSGSEPPVQSSEPRGKAPALERTGLCVVCQDEEANIAIVDCGHLAMCRGCSDMVMAGSRECPLCRTRIVTEARLLRIFKS